MLHSSVWDASANAAGLQFIEFDNKVTNASINYDFNKGNFHRFQDEKELHNLGFFTKGYVHLSKWKFYGDFGYFNRKDKGVKWVDVLKPYNYNPYTIGDSVGGTYHKEYFQMSGKAAWQTSEKILLGFNLNYETGVGARRKDPRPKNISSSFSISPAIIYNLGNIRIGGNVLFNTSKEDIEFTTVTDSLYSYLHFKGLGVYTSSFEKDKRSDESTLYGGALQFNYSNNKLQNLTEIEFSKKTSDIKRGESVPLQVVSLENFSTELRSTFLLKRQKNVSKLAVQFSDKHLYGHEPVVEPKMQQVNFQWETLAKYTLYWHKQQEYELQYSFYKLQNNHHINWGAKFSGMLHASNTEYYFVPQRNTQDLNYYKLNFELEKEFFKEKNSLLLILNSMVRQGFNSSYRFVDDEILIESVNTKFVEHDFEYYDSSLIELGGELNYGRAVDLYSTPIQVFISLKYTRQQSEMNENIHRNNLSLKLGVNF